MIEQSSLYSARLADAGAGAQASSSSLLSFRILGIIDFARIAQNQSWLQPRKAA
jgi:hypothetical protein